MSCKLRRTETTAFQDIEILKIALEKCAIVYKENNDKIIIPAWHYYTDAYFEKLSLCNNKLILVYDKDININIQQKILEIEKEYSKIVEYYTKLSHYRNNHEEELRNKAIKQKQEQEQIVKKIIEEAKLNNYQYSQRLNDDGSINIVLVRHL